MQGIDELTNIMQAGGRSDVPTNMGAQPMGAPQGIAGMMPPQDMAMMQQEQAPSPADSAPQGIDINSDADMLASAVVGRTNGNLDEAEQVLEQSLMLIQSAKAQSTQQPVMAAEGKPIPSGTEGAGLRALPDEVVERMGFVKAADGRPMTQTGMRGMSNEDLRTILRSIISNSLTGQQGRAMSDEDGITVMAREPSPEDLERQRLLKGMKRMRPSNKPGMAYGGEVEEYAGGGLIYLP